MTFPNRWSPPQMARIAGVLLLLTLIGGGFGEFYIPSMLIVDSDAAATAKNIMGSSGLWRLGFAAYLVEALCDVGLTVVFYLLLRPVHRDVALLAAFLRIVSTAVFAAAQLFYFVPLHILGGAPYLKTFPPDQLQALALLSLKFYGYGAIIPTTFYGVSWILLGWLMFRSGYLPKLLGALMALGGAGFAIQNLARVLAPAYASSFLLLPMMLGIVLLTVWLLIRGIDVAKWHSPTCDRADGISAHRPT